MIRPASNCKIFILAVVLSCSVFSLVAADRYSATSGNWNSTSTWSLTPGGPPGASVPGKNDDVYIENGHTVTVTEDYECVSVTFTGAIATLVINSPATLTLRNGITLNKLTNQNSRCNLAGTGTLICVEVNVGSDANPPPADLSSSVYTHTFTSGIANLNISVKGSPKNNLTVNSYIGAESHYRNGAFNLESGIVKLDGKIIANNADLVNTSTFSMATGSQSGTLILNGRSLPFSLSETGNNIINLNGSASTVIYALAGGQTALPTAYNNITLSGSGAKTVTGVTVYGTLSMEGIATAAGFTPTFGTLSALQYKGNSAQTTGIEFPPTFTGSGGIIINNVNDVTLNGNRMVEAKLTFISGKINTGTYALSLPSLAVVAGAGPGKYVNGNLQKGIATGTLLKTFEIGDASVYAPVNLAFSGTINVEGNITAKTISGDHPNIGSSTFNSGVTVNRYWTLTNSGVSGFISYSSTFNFVAGDIDAGADFNYFYAGNYNPSAWIYPAVGTLTATTTEVTGLTSFGDFQIGELPIASYRTRQSGTWNQVSTWETFSGSVWVAATGTPTSASGYITIRSSHVVTNTSTITADQVIIDPGGSLVLNSDMIVNDGPAYDFSVNGTLDCASGNLTGAGSFALNSFAELIIRSPDGIASSEATGNIRTATRIFSSWANYTYAGTIVQTTGNGLPASINNLTVENGSGVILTAPLTMSGTLNLTSGEFFVGMNELAFQTSDVPIIRTSGTITTTSATELSFGSPVDTSGAAFSIPEGTFTANPEIRNLSINRTLGIALNEQILTLNGIVLVNGPLNTNGNLTLSSTASGTALIDGTGTGEITGNVTMQRYLPSGFGYKYFSSPFQSATINELDDDMDLGDPFPTVYRYDESRTGSGWVSYINPAGVIDPMHGYAVNFGSVDAPNTVDITGIVNNGSLSRTLYNNNNTYTTGFNLVGNPYPSPIDWNSLSGWTKTNIDNALYFFRASPSDQYGGTYSTYINGISSDGLATNIIPSMQGFFVRVSDGTYPVTGTLALDNNVRVNDLTHSFAKGVEAKSAPFLRLGATFVDNTSSTDPVVIYFDEKATDKFDPGLDALKLMNTDFEVPNIYVAGTDGSKFSIRALPQLSDAECKVPLGLKLNVDGYIIFRIRHVDEELTGMKIYLTDIVANKDNDLLNDNEYRIFLNAGEYENRFYLNLEHFATNIPDMDSGIDLFSVYSSQGFIKAYINAVEAGNGSLAIYNMTGQIQMLKKIPGNGNYEFSPGLSDGIYIVTFTSGKYRSTKKIFFQNK